VALDTASGVAGDPAPGPETVYRSERTGVFRVPLPGGGTAIRKETRGRDAVARVRHEAAVLERLAGVPGVPGLIERDPAGTSMLLTDSAGAVLAGSARSADPRWVAGFARSLAAVLAAVHRRGVVHKDVNPSNVLLSDAGDVTLIDFDLATTFAEERPVFTHHSEVAGTLP
jgi:serine/threonine protein kinase